MDVFVGVVRRVAFELLEGYKDQDDVEEETLEKEGRGVEAGIRFAVASPYEPDKDWFGDVKEQDILGVLGDELFEVFVELLDCIFNVVAHLHLLAKFDQAQNEKNEDSQD